MISAYQPWGYMALLKWLYYYYYYNDNHDDYGPSICFRVSTLPHSMYSLNNMGQASGIRIPPRSDFLLKIRCAIFNTVFSFFIMEFDTCCL